MGEGLGMNGTRIWALLLAAGLALAGCSGGNEAAPMQLEIARATKGLVGQMVQGRKSVSGQAELSRAQLEAIGMPISEVSAERRDLKAYLFLAEAHRDETPGLIEVWMTGDQLATVTTRDGLLIATRGLGGDLLSSAVPQAPEGGPQSGALEQRIHYGDNRERGLALSCEVADLGPASIEILGNQHATRHLRQSCEGAGGQVINEYWRDPRDGTIWQSRQWAGPYVGYLGLRRVTK